MNAEKIVEVMRTFLTARFGVTEAQALLGPVENESNPENLILAHRDPSIERASLGMLQENGEPFLSTIFIKFARSRQLDLSKVIVAFGEPDPQPRLKPDQPTPYAFEVAGPDYKGNLSLGLEPGEGELRQLKTIRFMRFPPSWSNSP